MSLSDGKVHYLMESALVPILLQEFLLSFRLFISQFLRIFQIFFESLLLRHSSPPFNFFAFLFPSERNFLVSFNAAELAEFPGVKLGIGIESVRIVHVRY